MAKLKNVAIEEVAEQISETAPAQVDYQAVEKTEGNEDVAQPIVAVSEHADKILKKYPNYAVLAVDAQGGVYTDGLQHLSKCNAILYRNPYYKQ